MKVLHVLNTNSYSGAENVAITIINHMPDVESIYLSLNGPISEILKKNNIQYYPVDKLSIKSLKKAIRKLKPDVIHAHDYTASILCALCFPKAKIISHIHNNSPWIKSYGIYSWAYLFSSFFYKKILTVSDSIEKEYVFGKFIKNKIECIGNPTDIELIHQKAIEYSIDKKYDLIFLGRLTAQKNPKLLLEVFNDLILKRPDISIAVVGAGDQFESFNESIHKNNLQDNIEMYGFMENPYPVLNASNIMILPSKWEGYGLVAVESLSLGIPVICSGAGGLKNIVNSSCGKICKNKDDYVQEIIELLDNEQAYATKSNNAKERAKVFGNIQGYISKIKNSYK